MWPEREKKVYTVGELLRKLANSEGVQPKWHANLEYVVSQSIEAKSMWLLTIVRRALSKMPASEDIVDALLEAAWSYSRMRMHRAAAALLLLALNPHVISSYVYTLYPWPLRCAPSAYGYMSVKSDNIRLILLTVEVCGRHYGLLFEIPEKFIASGKSDVVIIGHHEPIATPKLRAKLDLNNDARNPLGVRTLTYEEIDDVLKGGNLYLLVEMLTTHYHHNDIYPLYNPGVAGSAALVFDYSERRGFRLIELRFPGEGEVRLKMWKDVEGGERVVNLEVEEAAVRRIDPRVADWYARRMRRKLYAEAAVQH